MVCANFMCYSCEVYVCVYVCGERDWDWKYIHTLKDLSGYH